MCSCEKKFTLYLRRIGFIYLMHIVHCLTHSVQGGGQAITYLLIKSLLQYVPDVRHTIVLPGKGAYVQKFEELNVPVVIVPLNRISLRTFWSLYSKLKQLQPDIIHSHGRGAGLYARLLPRWFLGFKKVHSHHGFHVPENKLSRFFFILLEQLLAVLSDITVAVSESEKKEIRKLILTAKHSVVSIPNTLDDDDIQARSGESLSLKIENILMNCTYPFKVVMIGRDDPIKNFGLALQSAAIVLKQESTSAFFFIGIGQNQKLQALKQIFPDRVFSFPMIENPLPVLRRASVLLITSKREGAPLVVLEAFALGKPVVGTNVRGINDYVVNGFNGLLVNETPDELGQALQTLASDKKYYSQLTDNARNKSSNITLECWARKYYDLYCSLL